MENETKVTLIGDTKIHGNVVQAVEKRAVAVGIALEMIKSTCAGRGGNSLKVALDDLDKFADQIQNAIKKKQLSP